MLTLTSQAERSDEEMGAALERLLSWGRKYLPRWFDFYVWVAELQQRGVLHYHMLLPYRIPKGLFRRLRDLWAVKYDMGAGSVDIKKMKSGKGAAKYVSKMAGYVSKLGKPENYTVGLDGEGMLSFEPWRVGRNGQPYERMVFRGRACDLSRAARVYAGVVLRFEFDLGVFPKLRGSGAVYFDTPADALAYLDKALSPPTSDSGLAPPLPA
jgi:hypothetical protein